MNAERTALLAVAVGADFDPERSERHRRAYRAQLHRSLDLREGIRSWIAEGADLPVRLAVASSSSVAWLEENLRRAGVRESFEVLTGGDGVRLHKPCPDVYDLALERLDLRAERAVAVEDTAHGVDAAHAAGLRCIAIPNPRVDPVRLQHADLVLGAATEASLRDVLNRGRLTTLQR